MFHSGVGIHQVIPFPNFIALGTAQRVPMQNLSIIVDIECVVWLRNCLHTVKYLGLSDL